MPQKEIVLRRNVIKGKNYERVIYDLTLKATPLISVKKEITEAKYNLALCQREKDPRIFNEFRMIRDVDFYTGIGKNGRPFHMAIVPYCTFVNELGEKKFRKISVFFHPDEAQCAIECGVEKDRIHFEVKELDSFVLDSDIDMDNELSNQTSEKKK